MSGCHDDREKQVSPIIEQMQKLEERINELEENYQGLSHEIFYIEEMLEKK